MRLGKAAPVLLIAAGFASASVVAEDLTSAHVITQQNGGLNSSNPQDGWQQRARRAFCDPYLTTAHGEIEQLKAQIGSSARQQQRATEECEKTTQTDRTLAGELTKYRALERGLVEAQGEIERLKEQLRVSFEANLAAERKRTDQASELAQATEKVSALRREIDLARQEAEELEQKAKSGTEQADTRERARAAALDRDLRATRKQLQRLKEERESGRASFLTLPFRM